MTRIPLVLFAMAASALPAFAKDKKVTVAECPAPVQAVIRHYSTQGTLEEVGLDEDSGQKVYEAKYLMPTGKRYEVHISAEGKVLGFEEKKGKGKDAK